MEKVIAQRTAKNYTVRILFQAGNLYPYFIRIESNLSGLSDHPIQYEDGRIVYDHSFPRYVKNLVAFMFEVMGKIISIAAWKEAGRIYPVRYGIRYHVRKFMIDNNLIEENLIAVQTKS